MEAGGQVGERPQVGGDVLADRPVAPGGALDEATLLVAQRGRQAVDLRLGDDRHRLVGRQLEEAADAAEELAHLVLGKGIVERQHRPRMGDLGESRRRGTADLEARAVGAAQRREPRLDGEVAQHQRVELGIGDARRRLLVIEAVVLGDLARQAGELVGRLRLAQLVDLGRRRGSGRLLAPGHDGRAASRRSAAARASPVTRAPDSMRAISSRRPSSSSTTSRVRTPSPAAASDFSTRQ